mmetsp:Transcript_80052/g.239825  ORF Transcript_80052/g.239825 Transcript_80052/m.239825 type:complete len:222 (+) Transcript_80052:1340-2005(+)
MISASNHEPCIPSSDCSTSTLAPTAHSACSRPNAASFSASRSSCPFFICAFHLPHHLPKRHVQPGRSSSTPTVYSPSSSVIAEISRTVYAVVPAPSAALPFPWPAAALSPSSPTMCTNSAERKCFVAPPSKCAFIQPSLHAATTPHWPSNSESRLATRTREPTPSSRDGSNGTGSTHAPPETPSSSTSHQPPSAASSSPSPSSTILSKPAGVEGGIGRIAS